MVGLAGSDPLVRNSSFFEEIDDWRNFFRSDRLGSPLKAHTDRQTSWQGWICPGGRIARWAFPLQAKAWS